MQEPLKHILDIQERHNGSNNDSIQGWSQDGLHTFICITMDPMMGADFIISFMIPPMMGPFMGSNLYPIIGHTMGYLMSLTTITTI